MSDEDSPQKVTTELLGEEPIQAYLGGIVAYQLARFGSCTFIVEDQKDIALVNPVNVFVSHERPPEGKHVKFLRPVLLENRPQFVATKEDGSLWEVEYVDALDEAEVV